MAERQLAPTSGLLGVHASLLVATQWHLDRDLGECRKVHAIAEIDRVGPRIKNASWRTVCHRRRCIFIAGLCHGSRFLGSKSYQVVPSMAIRRCRSFGNAIYFQLDQLQASFLLSTKSLCYFVGGNVFCCMYTLAELTFASSSILRITAEKSSSGCSTYSAELIGKAAAAAGMGARTDVAVSKISRKSLF